MKKKIWITAILAFFSVLLFSVSSGFAQEEDAARISVKDAKLIKKVSPAYPPDALEKKIEGTVIMEAVIDIYGKVSSVKIVKGVEELNQAAGDALKQWVYKPYIVNGQPKPVRFTVTMRFKLNGEKTTTRDEFTPEIKKKVAAKYPAEAIKAMVQGNVKLHATIDAQGHVTEAKVVSGHPLLNQAAIDAVKQWEYEPVIVDGQAKSVSFTVTVHFKLK